MGAKLIHETGCARANPKISREGFRSDFGSRCALMIKPFQTVIYGQGIKGVYSLAPEVYFSLCQAGCGDAGFGVRQITDDEPWHPPQSFWMI